MPTFNGISYPETDFLDYGYKTQVTSGTGVSLPRWQAALVDAIADAGKQMRTTSSSSVAIGTGTKTFVLTNDLPYQAGDVVRTTDTANSANYMYGTVSSYTSATKTLIMSVASGDTGGSGTIASWNVAVAGLKGATGSTGAGGFQYGVAGGSANAITVTLGIGSYTAGQPLAVKISTTNTSSTTVNADGLGNLTVKYKGANLTGGELLAGEIAEFRYDGTNAILCSAPANMATVTDALVYAIALA